MSVSHYGIRGGIEGRERVRVLAWVLRPTMLGLLERIVQPGMSCLDAGCGVATYALTWHGSSARTGALSE